MLPVSISASYYYYYYYYYYYCVFPQPVSGTHLVTRIWLLLVQVALTPGM